MTGETSGKKVANDESSRSAATTDGIEIRPATPDDYEAVASFTRDTWGEGSDYIPRVYHDWMDEQGDDRMTFVADAGDEIAGIAQAAILSAYEAWGQGMRVNPDYRGQGVSVAINRTLFDWAREQGAVVMGVMVFSWNQAGLGQARALGFKPVTEFRWLQPDPDPDGTLEHRVAASGLGATEDLQTSVDAAWSFWSRSEARDHLGGLGLDMDESWAVRNITREMLERAARETALFSVNREDGTRAMAYRTRTYDRENDEGETETWAEYGVGAWADVDAGEALLSSIAADAADCGADRTRILIPETTRFVSDGAYLRANISENPDFVMAMDLTGT